MPATTSLSLQALLKTAAARVGMDSAATRVSGLSPAAQALFVAVQINHRKQALTVVVVPTDEDAERFCADTRFFVSALEGTTAATLHDSITALPSLQVDPYQNLAPHFGVA